MVDPNNFNLRVSSNSKVEPAGGTFEKRAVPKGGKDFQKIMSGKKDGSPSQDDEMEIEVDTEEVAAEEPLPNILALASQKKGKVQNFSGAKQQVKKTPDLDSFIQSEEMAAGNFSVNERTVPEQKAAPKQVGSNTYASSRKTGQSQSPSGGSSNRVTRDSSSSAAGKSSFLDEEEETSIRETSDTQIADNEEIAASSTVVVRNTSGKRDFPSAAPTAGQAPETDPLLKAKLKQTSGSFDFAVNEKTSDTEEFAAKPILPLDTPAQPIAKTRGAAKSPEKVDESPFAVYKQSSGGQKKEKGFSQFTQTQPDLSYVNPLAGPLEAAQSTASVAEVKPTPRAPYIKELVTQLIDKLYTVQTEGKMETVVTIKHPPMFEGANLVVTSFNSANKEFNIAFENLSPQAKHLLDLQQNRNDLKLALEEKGYGIHIIVTTTEIEHTILSDGTLAQSGRDDRSHEEGAMDDEARKRQKRQG